jgi:hypothetical protein
MGQFGMSSTREKAEQESNQRIGNIGGTVLFLLVVVVPICTILYFIFRH